VKKYKDTLIFLIKFFTTYFILALFYNTYLESSQQKKDIFKTSSITTKVASQTTEVLTFFGYDAHFVQHENEMSAKLLIRDTYTSRVTEGCNSLSLIILFISFIIAFAGSIKATVFFILFGSILIYTINVLRIALLSVLVYQFPSHIGILHNLVFPAIIYGTIFMLWVLWVHKFSNFKR
jgi:exosortase family protein XrtF